MSKVIFTWVFALDTTDRSKLEKLLPGFVAKYGVDRVISLVERLGPDELHGLIAAERYTPPQPAPARAAAANPPAVKTELIQSLSKPEPQRPESVKLWPLVGSAAAKHNHGGAWRAWTLAKALDTAGSGWILKAQLWQFIAHLGIGERKRRRWIADALGIGLFAEGLNNGEEVYSLAGLADAAEKLDCKAVGLPAILPVERLISEGWRAYVWAAYLATLKGRPMSQACKESVTGISERTQRNYQNGYKSKDKDGNTVEKPAPFGEARRNYAKTSVTSDHLTGIREAGRKSAFITRGRAWKHRIPDIHEADYFFRHFVMFRLPDIRTVPIFVARMSDHKGRSRKAQKQLNHSLSLERAKAGAIVRLFHETQKGIEGALRKLARLDLAPWDQPGELFQLAKAGRTTNLWRPVAVEAY